MVTLRVNQYLDSNSLREKYQSAYLAMHSTETALLKVHDEVCQLVDAHGAAILVLLDLSAAFDTIDHDLLLTRLEARFGITGQALAWVSSYLSNRYQCVKINQTISCKRKFPFGVPQGSVLGPRLFTLYTAALSDIITKH